jgi:hypothetical protein
VVVDFLWAAGFGTCAEPAVDVADFLAGAELHSSVDVAVGRNRVLAS